MKVAACILGRALTRARVCVCLCVHACAHVLDLESACALECKPYFLLTNAQFPKYIPDTVQRALEKFHLFLIFAAHQHFILAEVNQHNGGQGAPLSC